MLEAMKALVGERPYDEIKKILAVNATDIVSLGYMMFEVEKGDETKSEATSSDHNIGIAVFSTASRSEVAILDAPDVQEDYKPPWCSYPVPELLPAENELHVESPAGFTLGSVPSYDATCAPWVTRTPQALENALTFFLKAAPNLQMAKDPNRTSDTPSWIWMPCRKPYPLDQRWLNAMLDFDVGGTARGCTVQELVEGPMDIVQGPIKTHAVLVQKVLATVPEDQKIEIVKALALFKHFCKSLAFSPVACFVTSQIQLEGLVAWASEDADDVFAPGTPTCPINEFKACLARSALEFIACFAKGDACTLKRCMENKHCNHTFCLWLQLLMRLVRRGTYIRTYIANALFMFRTVSVLSYARTYVFVSCPK